MTNDSVVSSNTSTVRRKHRNGAVASIDAKVSPPSYSGLRFIQNLREQLRMTSKITSQG